ncbi:MAG: trigger factor [Saprospiraceae bacterium]|nr:trigger factor [Saprospiraceae bacterium]
MVVRKDIDNCSAILTVTITRDVLKPKLDAELKKVRQRMPVKGFRPGQVPMDYLKKMYGSSIFTETLNELFSEELVAYLRESGLNILGQPLPADDQQAKFSINISNPDPEYAIDYEVGFIPKIEILGLDKSHSYERLTVNNLDELAEEDLQYARKRVGKRSNPTEGIEENDIVKIAARELVSEDGDVKEDGWESPMSFLVKNIQDEAFKAKLLTLKTGDTLRFNARSVENHQKDEMHRKYILAIPDGDNREVGDWFEGPIEEVSRVADAPLDQEFYDGYFGQGVSNKEEAIEKLKIGILQFYDVRSNALLFRSIQERLLELNKVELPDKFLKRWLGVTNQGKLEPAQIEREYPAFADNLRWSILRDNLLEAFGVEVTDEELKGEYARRVRHYFQTDLPAHILESSIERLMKDEKDVENTRRELESDKLLEAVRGQITLVDHAVSSEEFHKIVEEVTARVKAEQSQDAGMRTTLDEE